MNTEFKRIEDMTGADLVAEYNRCAVKLGRDEVKRFADRATGIKRVNAIRDDEQDYDIAHADVDLPEYAGHTHCPHCGISLDNGVIANGDDCNGKPVRLATEYECMACGNGFGADITESRARRSAGIAKSWQDPEVAAKRSQRNGCRVDGVEYRSVRAAFVALDLPLSFHIVFRGQLKAQKRIEHEGRVWELI